MSREEDLMRRLRAAFQSEARESLDAMATVLLDLERSAAATNEAQHEATISNGTTHEASDSALPLSPESVERIYREAHNLKGAARAVNFATIESLCQPLESVFAVWKKGTAPPHSLTADAFDKLHEALSVIGQILDAESSGQALPEVRELTRQLTALSIVENGKGGLKNQIHPVGGQKTPAASERSKNGDKQPVKEPPEKANPQPADDKAVSNPPSVTSVTSYTPPAPQNPAPQPPVPTPQPPAPKIPDAETVRIATAKLDALLLQVEEMLTAKQAARRRTGTARTLLEQLAQMDNEWAKVLPTLRALASDNQETGPALLDFLEWSRVQFKTVQGTAAGLSADLAGDGRVLGDLIDSLLDDTKKLLLLPSGTLLEQFPRTIRDLARERGKAVELITFGGEVEVDKRILEELKAPLIHLLRNAVDHGIEEENGRFALGKAARGTIELRVTQLGGEVEFMVRDDGYGINVAKIKDRAAQSGLLTPEEAFRLSDEAAAQLIFASEFSTSEKLDEVSGRGLGMAIVREKVEHLGGRITIETVPEKGTTFRLILPQTLATFRGLLVEAAGQTFVLPTADITRVARVRRAQVQTVGSRATIRLDGRTLRLLSLSDVLQLQNRADDSSWQTVVVLGGERGAAFGVDAVVDEQEVLVKRLGWPLSRVRHVAGATVLASGQAAPILNVPDLLHSATQGVGTPSIARPVPAARATPARVRQSILVVDDSITSRMLLKDILEASGFHVQTAVDGMDALTALRSEKFDLLVSDVDMPRLNGFDLVLRLRADAQLKDLPAVLVTGRDSREDRERGFDVGASAYVVKSNFDQSDLLEIVRRLI